MVNVKNVRELQQVIASFSNHFDMEMYRGETNYGTTFCLAGFACALAKKHQITKDNLTDPYFGLQVKSSLEGNSFSFVALNFLGITDYATRFDTLSFPLFFAHRWPRVFFDIFYYRLKHSFNFTHGYNEFFEEENELFKQELTNILGHSNFGIDYLNGGYYINDWFRSLAGYLALEALIEYGVQWSNVTYLQDVTDIELINSMSHAVKEFDRLSNI